MEIIRVTEENLEKEHICCAIANNKDCQVAAKKAWLSERFKEGLVFLKGDVRGKCFIEYIPAENAWAPVEADGYMYVDCLWVSGQFKGHGYSNLLLEECIKDSKSKGKKGLKSGLRFLLRKQKALYCITAASVPLPPNMCQPLNELPRRKRFLSGPSSLKQLSRRKRALPYGPPTAYFSMETL